MLPLGAALIARVAGCVDFVFTALTYAVVSLLKVCLRTGTAQAGAEGASYPSPLKLATLTCSGHP